MMKTYISIFLFSIISLTAISQPAEKWIDSVRKYRVSNPDTAIYYSQKAIKILGKKPNSFQYANLYNALGISYLMKGDYDAAHKFLEDGLFYAKKANNDTLQIFVYNNKGLLEQYYGTKEKAFKNYYNALKIGKKNKIWREVADTYNNIATCHSYYDAIDSSEVNFQNAINAYKLEKEKPAFARIGQADVSSNLGTTYFRQGKLNLAYQSFFSSLKIFEDENKMDKAAIVANNISDVYFDKNDYKKALQYIRMAIQYDSKLSIPKTKANALFTLGKIFTETKQLDSALIYFDKSLRIFEESNFTYELTLVYNSLGALYSIKKQFDKAEELFKKALDLNLQFEDFNSCSINYLNLSRNCLQQGKLQDAKNYIDLSRKTSNSRISFSHYVQVYEVSSEIYSLLGKYKESLEFLQIHTLYKDSLRNEKNTKAQEELEAIYQNDKKEKALQLEKSMNEKKSLELEHAEQEKKMQAYQIQLLFLGGLILLIFIFIVIRRSAIRKKTNRLLEEKNAVIYKQKAEVELQKEELHFKNEIIEHKQKEIIDSINYAQRLQKAILATREEINRHLPNHFLLYKPKDIVAGDFYFFESNADFIFYAAADCTGHGVPGAMVSIVCSNALNRSVKEFGLNDPGEILNNTRELILETFKKSKEEVKDGMDISIISINKKNQQIKWAGANNPLWYIVNSEILEIIADKQPIGMSDHPKPFTTHTLPNDTKMIYLFTDGFPDQFGGAKSKKLKYSNFNKLLLEISSFSMIDQEKKLDQFFENWKGNLEQLDDVCVIGISLEK